MNQFTCQFMPIHSGKFWIFFSLDSSTGILSLPCIHVLISGILLTKTIHKSLYAPLSPHYTARGKMKMQLSILLCRNVNVHLLLLWGSNTTILTSVTSIYGKSIEINEFSRFESVQDCMTIQWYKLITFCLFLWKFQDAHTRHSRKITLFFLPNINDLTAMSGRNSTDVSYLFTIAPQKKLCTI